MTNRSIESLRGEIIGLDEPIPVLGGQERRYVFLDNAASTPAFKSVLAAVTEFLPWYSGVHRGTGYKARVATTVFDETRKVVGGFVGSDPGRDVVVYGANTTGLINMLAARLAPDPDGVVVTTLMEHHSNDLPWRKHGNVVYVGTDERGGIRMDDLREVIARHSGRVRLVAVSGASNVTGFINPIHEIAALAHEAGAMILVDAAQLVAHRPVRMRSHDDPGHLDFVVFSGHKIYAPFGIGALIGPAAFFREGSPALVGGGAVAYVGQDEVEWADPPHSEEAGSPNVAGAVALAEALRVLGSVGMDRVASHERELIEYCTAGALKIPGITLYGPVDEPDIKVGVLPFTLSGLDHALVATILSTEGGVGVRNGNFCAQIYMRGLLKVSAETEKANRAMSCDSASLPGMVRASLGCYNNREDVDAFLATLGVIARGEYGGTYEIDPDTGSYREKTFSLRMPPLPWHDGRSA
jgi:cysteine desulfurase/selenocysteine lyase